MKDLDVDNDQLFALIKEFWADAQAIVRTDEESQAFRVTSNNASKVYATETVTPEFELRLGYSPGARTVVVFQRKVKG